MPKQTPLVAHVIYNLSIGGLENGMVNLINHMPEQKFHHMIICINDFDPEFAKRIQREDVEIISIHKKPGRDYGALRRLFQVFRQYKPAIVHTRNLAALDALLPAMLAGVKVRIHGEHGRDENDADGNNKKLQLLRKLHRPLISRYIALSKDLKQYLLNKIGIPEHKISQLYNGVDEQRFFSNKKSTSDLLPEAFNNKTVIGTVGRLQAVKNPMLLIKAYELLLLRHPEYASSTQLLFVGDGPARSEIETHLQQSNSKDNIYLAGARNDIPALLNAMDIFALPSLSEGISNTILEAMASHLPVIATAVGGNIELVQAEITGQLVESDQPQQLADAIESYLNNPQLREQHGAAGQCRVHENFSISAMIDNYANTYQEMLNKS